MAYRGPVNQWELFEADLEPAVGREQGGEGRPVLIVSNDGFNRSFDVVTVLPLTKVEGKERKIYAFEVVIPAGLAGNALESIIMPQQIRTISKMRLLRRLGILSDETVRHDVENRILDHLGIELDED
jgi:mRNA interferase MazF